MYPNVTALEDRYKSLVHKTALHQPTGCEFIRMLIDRPLPSMQAIIVQRFMFLLTLHFNLSAATLQRLVLSPCK